MESFLKPIHIWAILLLISATAQAQRPIWAYGFGGTGADGVYPHLMDAAGNQIVGCTFQNTIDVDPNPNITRALTANGGDTYIAKYSPSGDLIWVRHITGGSLQAVLSLDLDPAGNIIAGGYFYSTTDFGGTSLTSPAPLTSDGFLAKYSPDGDLIWVRQVTGRGGDHADNARSDAQGNIYSLGTFAQTAKLIWGSGRDSVTSNGQDDIYLAKYSPNGDLIWVHSFGGPEYEQEGGVEALPNGDVVFSGMIGERVDFDPRPGSADTLWRTGDVTPFLARFSAAGSPMWVNTFGTNSVPSGLVVDSQGRITMTGYLGSGNDFDPGPGTTPWTNQGSVDIFLAQYTQDGALNWARFAGGSGFDNAIHLTLGSDNSLLISGDYGSSVMDMDMGPGVHNIQNTNNQREAFYGHYTSGGEYIWSRSIGSTGAEVGMGVIEDGAGGYYLSGVFSGTVDFDEGPNVFNLTSAGGVDLFMTHYSDPNATRPLLSRSVMLAPNPAQDRLAVRLDKTYPAFEASILNTAGQRLSTVRKEGKEFDLDLSNLAHGLYWLEIELPEGRVVKKFSIVR